MESVRPKTPLEFQRAKGRFCFLMATSRRPSDAALWSRGADAPQTATEAVRQRRGGVGTRFGGEGLGVKWKVRPLKVSVMLSGCNRSGRGWVGKIINVAV